MQYAHKQPVLGIVPTFDDGVGVYSWRDGAKRVFLRRDYLATLARIGAIPVILNPDMDITQVVELCDGIIIAGGGDIDPDRYGEQPIAPGMTLEPAERYEWEEKLIEACDDVGIPILGICYGFQRLNVHYGGSLIQDIPTLVGSSIEHWNADHEVVFTQNFLAIPSGSTRTIASRHHQAIGRLAGGVEVTAWAADGVVESAIIRGRHYGMQWHPESDTTGVHVYHAFAEVCLQRVR